MVPSKCHKYHSDFCKCLPKHFGAGNRYGWVNAGHVEARAMPEVSSFCILQGCPSLEDHPRTVNAVGASALAGPALWGSVVLAFALRKSSAVGGRFRAAQRVGVAACWSWR